MQPSLLTTELPQPLPLVVEDVPPADASQSILLQSSESTDIDARSSVLESDSVVEQPIKIPINIPVRRWFFDYRFRSLVSSKTAYEFGMPSDRYFRGWSPLSRLEFPLNSSWHGLKFGLESPNREIHFEWLTPQQGIGGEFADYDWNPPNPDGSFTDLGYCKQRWTEGQMLDLGYKFRWAECLFDLPVEFWPLGGFRWQRLGIMCYDCRQVKEYNTWIANQEVYEGDVISFNQQYYICYLGGQLRSQFETQWVPRIDVRLQGDWGFTGGYNEDHHLLREGDRWTMETTYGDSWHVAFTAEARLSKRWSLGFQADYLKIDTSGVHRWLNIPEGVDCSWSDGVKVSSEQTWLTVFLRLSI